MVNLQFWRLPYREDKFFSLIFFLVFLGPLAFWVFAHEGFETPKLVVFFIFTAAAALSFLKAQASGKLKFKFNKPLFILLGLFLLFSLLATIFSADRIYSIFGFYYRFTNGLIFYWTWVLFLLMLLFSVTEDKLKFLLKVLVLSSVAISVLSFAQSLGISLYLGLEPGGFLRPPSFLGNPNYTAMFLAAVLPFCFALAAEAQSFKNKAYYYFAIFIILLAQTVLTSRGALLAVYISAGFALALMLLFRFPKKQIGIFFFSAILGVVASSLFLTVSRPQAVSSVVQSADSNTSSRLLVWRAAIAQIQKTPILGYGPGAFALFYERSRSTADVGVFDDAHNLFLHMGATVGLPFVFVFFGLLIMAGFYGLKKLRSGSDTTVVAALAALVAWVVGVSFNPVSVPMFILLAVILAVLYFPYLRDVTINFSKIFKTFFQIMAACLMVVGLLLLVSEQLFYFSEMGMNSNRFNWVYRFGLLASRINPTNQIYNIYKIAGEIELGTDPLIVVKDVEKFKASHPLAARNYVEANNFYAILYDRTKNKDYLRLAVDNLNAAIFIDPYYPERYGQLSLYYYQLGQLPEAKAALLKNLSLKQNDFSAFMLLAKIYQVEGKKQQTIEALTAAFKQRPDLVQLRYLIGVAKQVENIRQVPIVISTRRPDIN